jgi:hypothetical protein
MRRASCMPADYLMVFLGTQAVVAPTGAPSPDKRRTPTVIGRVTLGSAIGTLPDWQRGLYASWTRLGVASWRSVFAPP